MGSISMSARIAVVFGQFGVAADPINLPHFRDRLMQAGAKTILVQYTDSQQVYDFLHPFSGPSAIVGSSLGAMSSVVFAGYLHPQEVDFVGGFQPSDYDPSGHSVNIPLYHDNEQIPYDTVTRAIEVSNNVREALCFRNPVIAATGGLGHATYIAADPTKTNLTVIERPDVHPGDFGVAQDMMFAVVAKIMGLA
jgi:hypothetical protein